MISQRMISISLFLFTVIAAALQAESNDPNAPFLPSLRLTPEEVQELKQHQTYEPGYVHGYTTFGEGDNAVTVPIVEADYDIFLENDQGIKTRSLTRRGQCFSFAIPSSSCVINYCWRGTDDNVYSEGVTITGSNGQSNPSNVRSSNTNNLWFNDIFNNGYNGWFPEGHECSNSNTEIYTNHRLQTGLSGVASVDHVRCDNCNFRRLNCNSGSPLRSNLIAYSNGVSSQSSC